MVNAPQTADIIYTRSVSNDAYIIPFDFNSTGEIRVTYSDREFSIAWQQLIENIDYTVKINLNQGSVKLVAPDNLVRFKFLRIQRIIPISQPYALPNAYSAPNIEGIVDHQNKEIQQIKGP